MRAETQVRERRAGWAKDIRTTLTDRDFDILYALGTCAVLRTRDISRLFFGARATTNDRLRKLHCAGFVEAHVRDLASDNHYTLTAKGRDQVVERYGLAPEALKVTKKLPAKLEHLLAITDVRLHLAIACRAGGYDLVSFETDADLAAARHAQLLELIPDAKVTLRSKTSGEVITYFLEADLGTEAVTFLVRRKLATYARHAALGTSLYGVVNPLIVLVVPGLRRARNIARALIESRIEARVVFSLFSLLTETTVLAGAYALSADLVGGGAGTDAASIFLRRLLP